MNKIELKQLIDETIYDNTRREITGAKLNNILKEIVDFAEYILPNEITLHKCKFGNFESDLGECSIFTNDSQDQLYINGIARIVLNCEESIDFHSDIRLYGNCIYFDSDNNYINFVNNQDIRLQCDGNVEVDKLYITNIIKFGEEKYIQSNTNGLTLKCNKLDIDANNIDFKNAAIDDRIIIKTNGRTELNKYNKDYYNQIDAITINKIKEQIKLYRVAVDEQQFEQELEKEDGKIIIGSYCNSILDLFNDIDHIQNEGKYNVLFYECSDVSEPARLYSESTAELYQYESFEHKTDYDDDYTNAVVQKLVLHINKSMIILERKTNIINENKSIDFTNIKFIFKKIIDFA